MFFMSVPTFTWIYNRHTAGQLRYHARYYYHHATGYFGGHFEFKI